MKVGTFRMDTIMFCKEDVSEKTHNKKRQLRGITDLPFFTNRLSNIFG